MTRLEELTMQLLDGSLPTTDLPELLELAREDEGTSKFLHLVRLESELLASRFGSSAETVINRLEDERRSRVEEGVMRAVSYPRVDSRGDEGHDGTVATNTPVHPVSRMMARSVLSLAVVAAGLVLGVLWWGDGGSSENSFADLVIHNSSVTITDASGLDRSVESSGGPVALAEGESVAISRAVDSAEVVYPDGTRIELHGETRVTLATKGSGAKQVTVLSGLVEASVAPQPEGLPLEIVTSTAKLEVLGTTLGVEVRESSTQLEVSTGVVAMTRNADGKRVEVPAGRYARATDTADEPLQARALPDLPVEWAEDFESGLPAGWRSGELIEVAGNSAVRRVQRHNGDESRFVITSQNEWQEGGHGLCRIDEASVLHMRIRQSEFARLTIMLGTRSYPPTSGRFGANLFYTQKVWNADLPPGQWRTISIPLKNVAWHVRRGRKSSGAPDMSGLATYLVHVTTMDTDIGLMIDRLWITKEPVP